ncbi:hypothetical protein SAMN05216179_3719 [Gracilibacillus kekensis]|uniref:Uncharacterized protein n=1 Tax=Gracilibacillus kekensis TaxID=1027249 RepID=A0A1M7QXK8_9BACI|nr:hypothetical protein SAMN05216179_3719 [Gracilibacillus kekensis]
MKRKECIEINKKTISTTLLIIGYLILILVYWTIYTDAQKPSEGGVDPVGILFRFGIEIKEAVYTGAFLYAIVIFLNRKKFFSVKVISAIIGLIILMFPVLLLDFLEFLRLLRYLRGDVYT